MPRRKKELNERKVGKHTAEEVRNGLTLIRNGMSMRKASKMSGVPFATLKRYYHSTKNCDSLDGERLEPNYSVKKIFTHEQEISIKEYITYCHLLFYGLTANECRRIVFQYAKINNLVMPDSWIKREMTGKYWLMSFQSRHGLVLEQPEPCSLSKATSFNKHNVNIFYDNLQSLISRSPELADGSRIFNLDEISITTVHKPPKVIVLKKGKEGAGKVTSRERSTLVTTCCIIGASGIAFPPVMVFPTKIFQGHMIKNAPPGTLGLTTTTGSMNSTIFPEVMKHVIKHTNASKENPCILIMDNHESHLSIEALDLAKNAGVHILTLHTHTAGKLQPLDVGIYSPFKKYYNAAIGSWLLRHPGKPVDICDLGKIIGTAFQKVMTAENIMDAFAKCGIHPFDRHLFTDEDFQKDSVADQTCTDCISRGEGSSHRPPQAHSSNTESTEVSTLSTNHLGSAHSNMVSSAIPTHQEDLPSPDALMELQEAESCDSCPDNLTEFSTVVQNSAPALVSQRSISPELKLYTPDTLVKLEPVLSESTSEALMESQTALDTSQTITTPSKPQSAEKEIISPFEFVDPLKAEPRVSNRKRRRPRSSLIATDIPEKQVLVEEICAAAATRNVVKKKKTVSKVMQSDEEEKNEEEVVLTGSNDNVWKEEEIHLLDEIEEQGMFTLSEDLLEKPLRRQLNEGDILYKKCKDVQERKGKNADGARKKSPYMSSHQLEFLKDTVISKRIANSIELPSAAFALVKVECEEREHENDEEQSELQEATSASSSSFFAPNVLHERVTPVGKKRPHPVEEECLRSFDNYEERIKMDGANENVADDDNRHFLLSLVPSLASLPRNLNTRCRIELLQCISKYEIMSQSH